MSLSPFKLDIDDLIYEFAKGESTTLADMKRVWLSKKFSYIYEASPSSNLAFFMQSLYSHSIGYMISNVSLSHRLGGLFCLYCLYETQPFKPPFKIYLSLGELNKLKELVVDAKEKGVKVVSAVVKRMLEKNMFLFGCLEINEGSVTETVNQLTKLQNARIQVLYNKLFADSRTEHFLHMDLGMEVDLNVVQEKSTEYAEAKKLAIEEASKVVDVQDIKHISEDKKLIGDEMQKIVDDWNVQRDIFNQQRGFSQQPPEEQQQLLLLQEEDTDSDRGRESICQGQPMADDSASLPGQLAATTLNVSSSEVLKAEFSDRVPIRSIVSRPDGGAGLSGHRVRVGGWVKTGRKADKDAFAFLELNDGSCPGNLQVIVDAAVADLSPLVPTGTCVVVDGVLKLPPAGTKQKVELRGEKVVHVGPVDPAKYPLPKTRLTLEFLRDVVHLRPRTNTISAVARIRNALAYATHTFFYKHGFLYVHTPIVTTSDCEGAGEMFQVTTLISEADKLEKELIKNPPPSAADIEAAQLLVKEKGDIVAQLKSAKAGKVEINASVAELKKAKENLAKLEERSKLKPGIPQKDGKIDYTQDFFARQAFLTVSGQLQVESYACCLSSVYTFGPTFRAENSHTSRHLAEFWMVEPEIAFAELKDDMNCAEAYVKFMCQWLLDNCLDDMEFMADKFDKTCIDRLRMVASTPFERVSYTEAVEFLEEAVKGGKKFENKVEWGIDLASEHERYLTEVKFQKPVIVYNYPKGIKAFYMRLNDDSKTVAAMDVLVPKVGELIGGSQREERLEVIQQRILDMGLPLEPYEWYLDLRRFGTVKHSGFGLGFERMLLFATGIENIRDVIPFPRYPGRADL